MAADGRKFLVVHGDHFDLVVTQARWLALLGDKAYDFAITVNRPPVISGMPPAAATVGSLYSFAAAASDADGDALTFSVVGAPPWATLSSAGVLSVTPGPGDVGTFTGISIGFTDG